MEHSYYRLAVQRDQTIDFNKIKTICENIKNAEKDLSSCVYIEVFLTKNEITYLKLYGYKYNDTPNFKILYW